MRLQLFDFIDEIIDRYNESLDIYENANLLLINFFTKNFQDKNGSITSVFSRIKSADSLREKLIRNKFYIKHNNPEEALNDMGDIVGVTIECRFIKDEATVYNSLINYFNQYDEVFYKCQGSQNVFLNLRMPQPQLQRNGFPIYRIDGYILIDDRKVNFELQIKAMVHSFWSNIEHQVVYKNTKLVIFNSLISTMLGSIRDSLDVVDNQLEIIYDQIINSDKKDKEIGMTPETFKLMVATSINELVTDKMMKSVGVTTNFKQCSSILSQYIYITEFLNAENPAIRMVEYFEHLNYLKINEIDFTEELILDKFDHNDIFCKTLGNYWISVMNTDYDWHVFFMILFALQPGSAIYDFSLFIETVKTLIMPRSWVDSIFNEINIDDKYMIINLISMLVANSLVENGTLIMIHENTLYNIMNILKELVKTLEDRYSSYEDLLDEKDIINAYISRHIKSLF